MSDFFKRLDKYYYDKGYHYHYSFHTEFFREKSFSRQAILDWCDGHGAFGIDYICAGVSFWFKEQKMYNWFLLRWS